MLFPLIFWPFFTNFSWESLSIDLKMVGFLLKILQKKRKNEKTEFQCEFVWHFQYKINLKSCFAIFFNLLTLFHWDFLGILEYLIQKGRIFELNRPTNWKKWKNRIPVWFGIAFPIQNKPEILFWHFLSFSDAFSLFFPGNPSVFNSKG